jgi:sterol desaturase/sphingolipid hydroxylase (fatty acid hydroxylase superfamily)
MFFLLCASLTAFWVGSLGFAVLDYWNEKSGQLAKRKQIKEENNKINWITYRNAAGVSFKNQILVLTPMALTLELIGSATKMFDHHIAWPEQVFRLCISMLLEDFAFYWIHRAFHSRWLYEFHKLHHTLVEPFAVAAFSASFLENAVVNYLPVLAMPIIAGLNRESMLMWFLLATMSSVISHSGYCGFAFVRFHDAHHKRNSGNFGVSGFSDWLFGTALSS